MDYSEGLWRSLRQPEVMKGHFLEHCEAKKAKEFVNEAKRRLIQDNMRDKYDDFLKFLKGYKTQRFDHV